MSFVLTVLVVGFGAGLIARALVSGPGPKGCLPTTLLGLAGSLLGGWLGYVLLDEDLDEGPFQLAGLFGSILGAVIVLLIHRRWARA